MVRILMFIENGPNENQYNISIWNLFNININTLCASDDVATLEKKISLGYGMAKCSNYYVYTLIEIRIPQQCTQLNELMNGKWENGQK